MAGLVLFGVIRVGRRVIDVSQGAAAVLRDPAADDQAKEKAAQQASVKLLLALLEILGRGGLTAILSFLPILLVDWLGWAPMDTVTDFMARWDVIIVITVVMTAGWLAWKKLWTTN